MDINFLSIDFEYNNSHNARYNLVSVALDTGHCTKSIWLESEDIPKQKIKTVLKKAREQNTILLSFNVDAEARSLISLGLNPITFSWIDIQAEWKMLTNHCDKWRYRRHMIDGNIVTTNRLEYGSKKNKRLNYSNPPVNLLGCTYALLKTVGPADYKKKNEMRDLIIHQDTWTDEEKKDILDYGASDVNELYKLYKKIFKEFRVLYGSAKREKEILVDMLWRGETVARCAVIAATGYPVNREDVTNFTKNIPKILIECQEDINSQFPDTPLFRWKKREGKYAGFQKHIMEAIDNSPYKRKWPLTPSKKYSLKVDSFEKFFSWRHDFPKGNIFAQYFRYLKLKQSLNGFLPKGKDAKNKNTFFSHYGDDDRAHPYLNAYGSQTSRYQPKATGFLHLKAAWMRSMVQPKPGRAIASIDYRSEEFFLAGLMSGDQNMIKACQSGDVYLYFAKLAGAVPWEGTRKDYKKERDRFKSTVLGLSYGMGHIALANKLTTDTGHLHATDDAIKLSNQFWDAFPKYDVWIDTMLSNYSADDKLMLADSWSMFGDNDNPRSVANCPIQGMGAAILRRAIQYCQDSQLTVILPLHDALYIEYDSHDFDALTVFATCMKEAFAYYFEDEVHDTALKHVGLDLDTWSPDYEDGQGRIDRHDLTYNIYNYYIDERSQSEFKRYSKYFKPQ